MKKAAKGNRREENEAPLDTLRYDTFRQFLKAMCWGINQGDEQEGWRGSRDVAAATRPDLQKMKMTV